MSPWEIETLRLPTPAEREGVQTSCKHCEMCQQRRQDTFHSTWLIWSIVVFRSTILPWDKDLRILDPFSWFQQTKSMNSLAELIHFPFPPRPLLLTLFLLGMSSLSLQLAILLAGSVPCAPTSMFLLGNFHFLISISDWT